jgi:hypothetical protein
MLWPFWRCFKIALFCDISLVYQIKLECLAYILGPLNGINHL